MVRNVGKTITINKYIEVDEVASKEKITSIVIYPEHKNISVTVVALNESEEIIQEKTVNISGGNYDLLFSDNDMFGAEKQIGGYRESDLWKLIDVLEV